MGGVEDDEFISTDHPEQEVDNAVADALILLDSISGYCFSKGMHNVIHQRGHTVPSVLHHSGSDMLKKVTVFVLSPMCQSDCFHSTSE